MKPTGTEWPDVTPEFVASTVERVADVFGETYFDPLAGAEMREHLRARLTDGAFATIETVPQLASL